MNTPLIELETHSRLGRGYFICIISTIIWSSTAVFIRYLTNTYQIPALVLAFWRDLFLAVGLGLFLFILNRKFLFICKGDRKFLFGYGLVLSLFNSLWTVSVLFNGAALSTVMVYSSAGFTALLGWWLFGEHLRFLKIIAVSLSLIGCVYISGAYDPAVWKLNPVGVVTGLASGIGFAGYSLMGKLASKRSINPWTALAYTFGFAALWLFLYNLFAPWLPQGVASRDFFFLGDELIGWLLLFALSLGPTLGGYGLYMVSLNYLPASVANIIATLEPVMTSIMAFFLLAERFTVPQWLGAALIISGVIVLRVSERRIPLLEPS